MKGVANFFFEMGQLAKTPRAGMKFLGAGSQNVAEHTNRVCYIGYALAMLDGTVDAGKVVQMCLFHDMAEARSLDHGYVAQQYVKVDEERILHDQTKDLPFGESINALLEEYFARTTKEAIIAKDADDIELLVFLKQEHDLGSTRAQERMRIVSQRLRTDIAKSIRTQIQETSFDDRWFSDKNNPRRVNRNKQ